MPLNNVVPPGKSTQPLAAMACYDFMAGFIVWRFEKTDSSFWSIETIKDQLHKSAMTNTMSGDPAKLAVKLLTTEFMGWAALLRKVHGWRSLTRKSTQAVVELDVVLRLARSEWQQIGMQLRPDFNETECLQYVADYISVSGRPVITSQPITYLTLWRAACAASLLGVGDREYDFTMEDYQRWALTISKKYSWQDRRPQWLWNGLSLSRNAWRKEKVGHLHISSRLATPKRETEQKELEGDNTMGPGLLTTFSNVDIEDEGSNLQDEGTTISRKCDFCEKEAVVYKKTGDLLDRISPAGFFCSFCVRHNFHTKYRRNVMIVSFRGLIGYLYHFCYFGKKPRLYLSQICDLIDAHVKIGHLNPVFVYDPDTYCWFIDFNKVGASKKRVPIKAITETINEIASAFNPYDYIKDFKSNVYVGRFAEAVNDFYHKRYRPDGKRICIPSLLHCACDMRETKAENANTVTQKKVDISVYRNFSPPDCKIHNRR